MPRIERATGVGGKMGCPSAGSRAGNRKTIRLRLRRSRVRETLRSDRIEEDIKLQFLLVAGLNALLGYAAAYGKLNPFQKADAGPAGPAKAAAPADKDREADRDAVRGP